MRSETPPKHCISQSACTAIKPTMEKRKVLAMLRTSIIAMMLLASTATYAGGRPETSVWKNMGAWDIRIDHTLGDGCYMVMIGVQGTQVRLGYNGPSQSGQGYIFLGSPVWQSIKEGQKYTTTIGFDAEPTWTGTATGRWIGNTPGLFMSYSDRNLSYEFADRQYIKMWFGSKMVTNLSLATSYPAMEELVKCQDYVDANRQS